MKLTKFLALFCAASALLVACDPDDQNTPEPTPDPTGDLVLSVSPETGEVGSPITFTVMQGDVDVTTMEDLEIYETENYTEVSNPFTPTIDGEYTFYAVLGPHVSNRVTINVNPVITPLPNDPNEGSTSFKHRLVIVEHTATGCGYCPEMKAVFRQLHEDEIYNERFYVAEAHYGGLAGNDPAKSSDAASVGGIYAVDGFPQTNYNFFGGKVMDRTVTVHKQKINSLWQESAVVGIAASTTETSEAVFVNVELKSAKEQDYRVACWLLEDDIYGRQSNYGSASGEWINYHNNCIRKITGKRNSGDISGDDFGVIKVGEKTQKLIEIPIISQKWVRENLKVLIIVTADNGSGKYEIVNSIMCPLNDVVAYDYN